MYPRHLLPRNSVLSRWMSSLESVLYERDHCIFHLQGLFVPFGILAASTGIFGAHVPYSKMASGHLDITVDWLATWHII